MVSRVPKGWLSVVAPAPLVTTVCVPAVVTTKVTPPVAELKLVPVGLNCTVRLCEPPNRVMLGQVEVAEVPDTTSGCAPQPPMGEPESKKAAVPTGGPPE